MPKRVNEKNKQKSNKRGQGEGSIRQRKDGSWEARYTIGRDSSGKQIRKSVYGKTRPEVAKKLTKALNEINMGTYIEHDKMTVEQWLDVWFNEYKVPIVKPKTLESYESIIRLHIKPAIGHIILHKLRPEHVQSLYNSVAKKLSPRMAELTHVTLHNALDQALKNNIVFRNVTEATTLPKKKRKEQRVLTLDEQKKFMAVLKGDRLEAAFMLALFTGLRRGEILGLKWTDVDFKGKTIKINRTLCRVKNFDETIKEKTKLAFDTPKSDKSNRTIPLLDEIEQLLTIHKKNQAKEKSAAVGSYENNKLIFCNKLGQPMDPQRLDQHFKELIKKAGIEDANLHALRHTFATRGLENGIELKVMQELLGHSTIALTGDTYSHVLPDKKREAINKLKGIIS